jgi:hypothetical protein
VLATQQHAEVTLVDASGWCKGSPVHPLSPVPGCPCLLGLWDLISWRGWHCRGVHSTQFKNSNVKIEGPTLFPGSTLNIKNEFLEKLYPKKLLIIQCPSHAARARRAEADAEINLYHLLTKALKLKTIFISRPTKTKPTNSQCGFRECGGRVGVDAGTSTLLLIRFHVVYTLPVQAYFVFNFETWVTLFQEFSAFLCKGAQAKF